MPYVHQTGLFLPDTQKHYIFQNPLCPGGLHTSVLANGMWAQDMAITAKLAINTARLYLLPTQLGVKDPETGRPQRRGNSLDRKKERP